LDLHSFPTRRSSDLPCKLIPREQRAAEGRDIVYFISTTDNYSVFDNLQRDIDVNLKVLMQVLENLKDKDHCFNFISSWFVYGERSEEHTSELQSREN